MLPSSSSSSSSESSSSRRRLAFAALALALAFAAFDDPPAAAAPPSSSSSASSSSSSSSSVSASAFLPLERKEAAARRLRKVSFSTFNFSISALSAARSFTICLSSAAESMSAASMSCRRCLMLATSATFSKAAWRAAKACIWPPNEVSRSATTSMILVKSPELPPAAAGLAILRYFNAVGKARRAQDEVF